MKHLKKFEESSERMFESPEKHEPKHKYDCEHCKYNWCCGFSCRCDLHDLPEAPSDSLYGSRKKYNL